MSPSVRAPQALPRRARLAALLVAAALAVGSLLPASGGVSLAGPLGLVGADKYVHAAGYAALAGTLGAGLERRPRLAAVLAVAVAVGWGLGLELLQTAVPGRSFETADLVANGVGALLGAVGWLVLGRRGGRLGTGPRTER